MSDLLELTAAQAVEAGEAHEAGGAAVEAA